MSATLLEAAKHALEFIESIDGYANSKSAMELRGAIEAVEHSVQRMRCTCRKNFEGGIIQVDPNCPVIQAAHR